MRSVASEVVGGLSPAGPQRRVPTDTIRGSFGKSVRPWSSVTTTIRDTGHMDFTDLPLLSPFLGNMLGSGERDTAETMTIVNSLVLQFFNCYLKGEGTFSIEEVY